jgi:hypothetical protein
MKVTYKLCKILAAMSSILSWFCIACCRLGIVIDCILNQLLTCVHF